MAIFRVPRITTVQRNALVLQEAEIVYDTDNQTFYGGDNVSAGGFPIGGQFASYVEIFVLTQTDIDNKFVTLATAPSSLNSITLLPAGGIPQTPSLDFTLLGGNILSWNGLGLDNFLEVGETITVTYF